MSRYKALCVRLRVSQVRKAELLLGLPGYVGRGLDWDMGMVLWNHCGGGVWGAARGLKIALL